MFNNFEEKILTYPPSVRNKFNEIRGLIYETANENELSNIEETLKWGEPAFLAKGGSTVRINWKESSSDFIHIYFNCNTTLVETFREVFFDVFEFEGNRAIRLNMYVSWPVDELKQCFDVALRYHKVKHLPLLGF